MYIRRFSAALVSTLVGYGAWYTYQGNGNVTSSTPSSTASLTTTADSALPTRTVLVIGADDLRTGTVVGDAPLTKVMNESGRKVIEMLSPEQVDEKLRGNEQSYLVNRGEGVVRYDLVQLASNSPIEDDHAEKIVQVPSLAKGAEESSDWMFWGVFDGHSFVSPSPVPCPLGISTTLYLGSIDRLPN
jgi:pyruvate dehydrogenase phosphatase